MPKQMNLVGDRYGELEVVSYSHKTPNNGMSHYLCKCSCGKEKVISHGNLRFGHTTSCGCKQFRSGVDNSSFVHGFPKSHKTYKSWCKIKERCYNPNDISYQGYGAKGISMSDTLREDFLAFYAQVGEPPENSPRWSVDRINNSVGYIEGNLRWADQCTQARNKGMSSSNRSGITGVQFYHSGNPNHATYVVATWSCPIEQKPMNKKFSVKKLGLLPAFKSAIEYRENKIAELNAQGAGYTENHGK